MFSVSVFLLLSAVLGSCRGSATVHVVPHSHCDAGYRKTFEAYFTGEVKSILDTVLQALQEDSSKRFVWEEVSFLSRWWQGASEQQKEAVRELHAAGQLEFIGGGWVMHDEAVTSLRGILNQMTEGLFFLNGTLGVRPRVGWHIDPFGHSSFTPELFSLLAYDAFVLNRIPDPVKQEMKKNKGLEFRWQNPHSNHTIFAHVLDSHYATPLIFGVTARERAESFVNTCRKRLQWYKTGNLLLPFGNDFHFQNAPSDFKDMDEILKYISANPTNFDNITVKYSTLSEYFEAVAKSGTKFNKRTNDFFPYIACSPCFSAACGGAESILTIPCGISDSYWSGFYTSKPSQKLLVRAQEASLHALEVINALHPNLSIELRDSLNLARNTSALLQHHDAVTGTSYPDCYVDYNKRLEKALAVGSEATAKVKTSVLCRGDSDKVPTLLSDSTTILERLTNDNAVAVVIQNSLETSRYTYITITLPNDVCVKAENGTKDLLSQQLDGVLYVAVHLRPLAVQVIWLKKTKCPSTAPTQFIPLGQSVEITNKALRLQFNESGHLSSWTDLSSSVTHPLQHSYLQEAERENLNEENVCDGTNVYTFVPDDGSTVLTPKSVPITVTASGPLVWEVQQQINSYINTTWRLFAPHTNSEGQLDIYSLFAQWQTKIGPLPSHPHNSVLSQLQTTGLGTADYTTYASGYYPVKRSYKSEAPLQANTYPLVGRAVFPLTEGDSALSIITQRPVALSYDRQSIDIMLHRRIDLLFDARGDDSSVMDDPMLTGFIHNNNSDLVTAHAMREHRNPPTLHFALLNSTSDWDKYCSSQWLPSAATNILPHIHSIRLLNRHSSFNIEVGIRLMNVGESGTHRVDISALFREWELVDWKETTPDFLKTTSQSSPKTTIITLPPLELHSLVMQLQRV